LSLINGACETGHCVGNVRSRVTADYLPRNVRLSADRTTLTLRRMCKRSADGTDDLGCSLETDSGPMVVQCNASNKHGYVFANGYINVLGTRTV